MNKQASSGDRVFSGWHGLRIPNAGIVGSNPIMDMNLCSAILMFCIGKNFKED